MRFFVLSPSSQDEVTITALYIYVSFQLQHGQACFNVLRVSEVHSTQSDEKVPVNYLTQ